MNLETTDIKEGIRLHKIKTNKYKTNLMSVFLTSKLSRDDIEAVVGSKVASNIDNARNGNCEVHSGRRRKLR